MSVEAIPQLPRKEHLQWRELSFTQSGLTALHAYREQAAKASGRSVSLAMALDGLIKSHPFYTGNK